MAPIVDVNGYGQRQIINIKTLTHFSTLDFGWLSLNWLQGQEIQVQA